jgi:hypothetical protein
LEVGDNVLKLPAYTPRNASIKFVSRDWRFNVLIERVIDGGSEVAQQAANFVTNFNRLLPDGVQLGGANLVDYNAIHAGSPKIRLPGN